jgi:dienelactone hydrolase
MTNSTAAPPGVHHSLPLDSSAATLSVRGSARNEQWEAYFRRRISEQHAHFTAAVTLNTASLTAYLSSTERLRQQLLATLGGWPERPREVNATVEAIGDLAGGRLYWVQVNIVEEVTMPALLLIPQAATEKPAPVVICQHGYAGSPEWMMGFGTTGQFNYTNSAGRRLAEAGYVVIAPQIVCSPPGVGKDRVRLDRLARLAGVSLLGMEMFALSRVVDWLQTRPEVLPDRIGMYGISQGGKSTLYFSALEPRIQAAVCSCYFNQRWNKMLEDRRLDEIGQREGLAYRAYLVTEEDDKFNVNTAPLWPDHLLGALICPRPFMVEIGRYDPVIYWQDAVEEFTRLRQLYTTLGIEERAQALVANWGGHEMFYDDAKRFLDRWLQP